MSDADDSKSDRSRSGQLRTELQKVEIATWWVCVAIAATVLVYAVAMGLQQTKTNWRLAVDCFFVAMATALLVAIASLLVGGLLGFLFGIPKSLQQPKEAALASSSPPAPPGSAVSDRKPASAFATNTSLEEISDWLTKIIVGLGLIEFERVLQAIYWCALAAASFAGQQTIAGGSIADWTKYGSTIAVAFYYALIVSSLIVGLLFMYMETRTRVAILFNRALDADDIVDALKTTSPRVLQDYPNLVAEIRGKSS